MGLFDFARDIGRKLFDTDAEAADNIKEHLNTSLSGVTNLDVKFDDGNGKGEGNLHRLFFLSVEEKRRGLADR